MPSHFQDLPTSVGLTVDFTVTVTVDVDVAIGQVEETGRLVLQAQVGDLRQGRDPRLLPHHVDSVVHKPRREVVQSFPPADSFSYIIFYV